VQNPGVHRRIRAPRALGSHDLAQTFAPQRYFALHARAAGGMAGSALVLKLFFGAAAGRSDSDDLAKILLKFSLKAVAANC
jgi:hypothetical protein